MRKPAETSTPILPVLAERWSPRSFVEADVRLEDLTPAFEAARWAPSANNSQPWRFYSASKAENPEGFAKLLGLLMDANALWAQNASVLIIGAAQSVTPEGRTLAWGTYDLGQAMATFAAQATHDGYHVHQMGGFHAAAATEALGLEEGWSAIISAAVGKVGAPDALPEALAAREVTARQRKDLDQVVLPV